MKIKTFFIITILIITTSCSNAVGKAELTDRTGKPIKLPSKIEKIVSLSPAITSIIVDLGEEKRLAAVDSYSAEYLTDKSIATYDMASPDAEAILALKPSVVFMSNITTMDGAVNPLQPLIDAGVCVAEFPTANSLEEIKSDITFVAETLKVSNKGLKLITVMEDRLANIAERASHIADKKKVMFEVGALPYIYSMGSGTLLNDILELCGAVNVFAAQEGWFPVNEEAAIASNPDVILTNVNYIDDPVGEILSRKGWENVSAVKNAEVHYIDTNNSSTMNHNIALAAQEIINAIYGE